METPVKSKRLTNFNILMERVSKWLNKDLRCSSTEIADAIMFVYQYFNPVGIPWYSPKSIKDFDNKKDVEKYYEADFGKEFVLDILSDCIFKYKKDSNPNISIYFYIHVNDKMNISAPEIKGYTYEYALNPAPFLLNYNHRLNSVIDIENNVGKKDRFDSPAIFLKEVFKKADEIAQSIPGYEMPNKKDTEFKDVSIFYNFVVKEKQSGNNRSLFYYTILADLKSDEQIPMTDINFQSTFVVNDILLDIDTNENPQIHSVRRINSADYDEMLKKEKGSKTTTTIDTSTPLLTPINNTQHAITADNTSLTGKAKKMFNQLYEKASNFVSTSGSTKTTTTSSNDFLEKIPQKQEPILQIKRIPLRIQNEQEEGRTYNGISKTVLSLAEDRE